MLAANPVELGNKTAQTMRRIKVPPLNLVLLVVDILFAPRHRNMLHQLVGRAIDPPTRRQRRRHRCPREEDGTLASVELRGQNIRRIRPEVRDKEIAHRRRGQFQQILGKLVLGSAPRVVGIALGKADLRQMVHHLRAGKGF